MLYRYSELKGENGTYPPSWEDLFEVTPKIADVDDLLVEGHKFKKENYSWEAAYDETLDPPIRFKITVTAPKGFKESSISKYEKITIDHNGVFEIYKAVNESSKSIK